MRNVKTWMEGVQLRKHLVQWSNWEVVDALGTNWGFPREVKIVKIFFKKSPKKTIKVEGDWRKYISGDILSMKKEEAKNNTGKQIRGSSICLLRSRPNLVVPSSSSFLRWCPSHQRPQQINVPSLFLARDLSLSLYTITFALFDSNYYNNYVMELPALFPPIWAWKYQDFPIKNRNSWFTQSVEYFAALKSCFQITSHLRHSSSAYFLWYYFSFRSN